MAVQVESIGFAELIDPRLEEFIRESERIRIISLFAVEKYKCYYPQDIIAKICGFEPKEKEDGLPF